MLADQLDWELPDIIEKHCDGVSGANLFTDSEAVVSLTKTSSSVSKNVWVTSIQ